MLIDGTVQGTEDAQARFLTGCIDPICDQLQEEINRKRYGYEAMRRGDYLRIDTSGIRHFDMFANAANVEKLVGSAVFTVNDILRAAGLPTIPDPWADEHYLTKNIATLSESVTSVSAAKGGNE